MLGQAPIKNIRWALLACQNFLNVFVGDICDSTEDMHGTRLVFISILSRDCLILICVIYSCFAPFVHAGFRRFPIHPLFMLMSS